MILTAQLRRRSKLWARHRQNVRSSKIQLPITAVPGLDREAIIEARFRAATVDVDAVDATAQGGQVRLELSLHFGSHAAFDSGIDLDSPVSLDYYDQAPFAFNRTIAMTPSAYTGK